MIEFLDGRSHNFLHDLIAGSVRWRRKHPHRVGESVTGAGSLPTVIEDPGEHHIVVEVPETVLRSIALPLLLWMVESQPPLQILEVHRTAVVGLLDQMS